MTMDLALVLLLLAAAVAMFVANKPRMDAVALLMIVLLPLTGVVTMGEALAGFSDANIVLIAAMFVIGEGLVRTGVARRLGDWLNSHAGSSEIRLLVLLMLAVGGLGALMSSTAVVAIFIPVVLRISQNTGMAPSRLMMPLSVAALISGMLTQVATAPNLVVNSELIREGEAGFGFFSFTPFGLPLLMLGIVYMIAVRGLLGSRADTADATGRRPSLRDWIEQYRLVNRAFRVRVTRSSPLVGKRVGELSLRSKGVNLLAIERSRRFATDVIRPTGRTELLADDILLVDVLEPGVEIEVLRRRFAVETLPLGEGGYFTAGRRRSVWWRSSCRSSRAWLDRPCFRPGSAGNSV
jgi:di/tricarboxylate transporter